MIVGVIAWLAGCGAQGPYLRKDGAWRFGKEAVDVPKGETLTPLNGKFAKSATKAWYRASPIDGADAATFAALDDHHAKDAAHVWFAETYRDGKDYFTTLRVRIEPLPGADPSTFNLLDWSYSKDKARAFYEYRPFDVADVATFEPLDANLTRDHVRAYYLRTPIKGSDGATFNLIGKGFSRDARSVFWSGHLENGEPGTLKVVGADPASFEAFDYDYGRDKDKAYSKAKSLGPVTGFQVLDYGYAKTPTAVFYDGRRVDDADPASFEILNPPTDAGSARDKNGLFKEAERAGT